jgi:hypothetical protein
VALCAVILASGSVAIGAEIAAEYQLKAEFLERFTRFIDWPANSPVSDPAVPFVIGVLGPDPFGSFLDELAASHRIKGKNVEIRRLSSLDNVNACDVLFISATEKKDLRKVLSRTDSKPILTVSDSDGFGSEGVLINFYTEGDKIRFEINVNTVDRSGLKVKSKLLKLARLVDREGT